MKILVLVVCAWLLPIMACAEVKIIEVKHRAATDLEQQVRELLDEGEKVQAAGSHLVLIADGESLLAAEKLINLLDSSQQNLLIRIRQSEKFQQVGSDVSAQVHYGNVSGTKTSPQGSVRLGNSNSHREQSLRLVEGGRGVIEIGREIPFTEQWSAITGDNSGYAEKTAYKTISTGFWVSPVKLLTDKVLVDVEPYISDAKKAAPGIAPLVDYSQLRTRLQVPIGKWYPLGSQLMNRDRVSRAIISWRSSGKQSDRELEIRIDPVE